MTWFDLGVPKPRETIASYDPFLWPEGKIAKLAPPVSFPSELFVDVALSRRSKRIFKCVSLDQLSQLLWLSARCQEKGDESLGFSIERRPVPSAGAIHPIHILVFQTSDRLLRRYDPINHVLISLDGTSSLLERIKEEVEQLIPLQEATGILFVAEPGKTSAKYSSSSSLVWRDAGVLLGHIGLAAESLGLNYCPLGITGEPWVSQLDSQGKLSGVGLALLGFPS